MNNEIQKWAKSISLGDEYAFRLFFDHFYPRLYGYAQGIVKSNSLSEEVVSDVFTKVWQHRSQLPAIENVTHYMFRAVKNQSLNYMNKKTLHVVGIDNASEKKLASFIQPEQVVLDKELAQQIKIAIDGLPPHAKLIYGLIREDGMKYKEVAELLDLSIKTVENQMTIATKKLREALLPYFKDNPSRLYVLFFTL